jgi:hypothetical protein
MDISQAYAIVVGGSFCLLLLINGLPLIARLVRYLSPPLSKHLIYRYVLYRHRLLGPWSRADVLVQLIYIAGNIYCFEFWDITISMKTQTTVEEAIEDSLIAVRASRESLVQQEQPSDRAP